MLGSDRPAELEQLVDHNADRLYRAALAILASPQEAEDAVQDAFVRYLEKAPKDLENPGAWLMRVLVNGCRSRLRAPWRRRNVPLPDDLPVPGPEEREELEELMSLPERDRLAVHLRYYEGYSTREIAQITGEREGTVRSRLSRARSKLRRLIEGGTI